MKDTTKQGAKGKAPSALARTNAAERLIRSIKLEGTPPAVAEWGERVALRMIQKATEADANGELLKKAVRLAASMRETDHDASMWLLHLHYIGIRLEGGDTLAQIYDEIGDGRGGAGDEAQGQSAPAGDDGEGQPARLTDEQIKTLALEIIPDDSDHDAAEGRTAALLVLLDGYTTAESKSERRSYTYTVERELIGNVSGAWDALTALWTRRQQALTEKGGAT